MKKIILRGKEARQKLRTGVNFAADLVAHTLGPKGTNTMIGRQSTSPRATNDGSSIIQAGEALDETEQMGYDLIKEAARLVELEAFDGTTSVSLMTRALLNDCLDRIDSDSILSKNKISPMEMKEEIEKIAKDVVKRIKEKATKIESREDILKSAKVSVENTKLAEIITDVFMQIGKDGIIISEEGGKETTFDIVKGIEIPVGLDEKYGGDITIKNAQILVSTKEINDINKLVPILEGLVSEKRGELVIFAKSFSKEVLEIFIKMHVTGEFTVIPVRTTIPDKNYQIYDIAAFTGAMVYDDVFHKLGSCETFKIDKEKSLFISGSGDTKNHITKIEEELKSAKTEFDKEIIQKRISSLSGGVAVIYVGAPSQLEKGYLKDKLDDAVQSVRGAIREGVVKGRGATLKEISDEMGTTILTNMLEAVHKQININGVIGDGSDIIDGVPVVVSCVTNACSVAGTAITTEVTIAIKNETTKTKSGDIDA